MNIHLGNKVIGSDGEEIGTVESLIINRDTMDIDQFTINTGMMGAERVIEAERIREVDGDGNVHVSVVSGEVEELPPFQQHQYTVATEDDLQHMPQAWATGAGGGPLFWGPSAPTAARGQASEGSMFEPAPANPPTTEAHDTMVDDGMIIDKGTDVTGRDGSSLGSVEEVLYDGKHITGFIVKAGMIFTHDVRVPVKWVESVTADGVQLSVTAEEAENAGKME